MIRDAIDAFEQVFSPPFRKVMLKSLALTLGVLILAWLAFDWLILSFATSGPPWLKDVLNVVVGVSLFIAMVYLAAPATSAVGSFFVDEIAGNVERSIYADGARGKAVPAAASAAFALRFAGVSLLVNMIALALWFLPVIDIAAFFGANGYLLGREYFELAAMRFRSPADARAMRRHFAPRVYLYGVVITGFVAIPILNLFTPLFATALMTRLHKRLS